MKKLLWDGYKIIAGWLVGRNLGRFRILRILYKLTASVLAPGKVNVIETNGYKMQVLISRNGSLNGASQHILLNKTYEPETTATFKRFIKEGMKVIDIGANVGYYTLLASKLAGDSGKVIAVEPIPENYNELITNIKLNGMTNIEVVTKAISDKIGFAKMFLSDIESGNHSLFQTSYVSKRVIKVALTTIDSLLNSDPVDFIKSDTEGNEPQVLLGARETLKRNPNLKLILECWAEDPDYVRKLWGILLSLGLQNIYYLCDKQATLKKLDSPDIIIKEYRRNRTARNILCSQVEIN